MLLIKLTLQTNELQFNAAASGLINAPYPGSETWALIKPCTWWGCLVVLLLLRPKIESRAGFLQAAAVNDRARGGEEDVALLIKRESRQWRVRFP